MSSYVVEQVLDKHLFFMDVSPNWWLSHRSSNSKILQYVKIKFERDYYPRMMYIGRNKIDLDDMQNPVSRYIRTKIENGEFVYEFLPEEEIRKAHYVIQNGNVLFENDIKKQNARLKILIPVYNSNRG